MIPGPGKLLSGIRINTSLPSLSPPLLGDKVEFKTWTRFSRLGPPIQYNSTHLGTKIHGISHGRTLPALLPNTNIVLLHEDIEQALGRSQHTCNQYSGLRAELVIHLSR